jgi:hypothetical protein
VMAVAGYALAALRPVRVFARRGGVSLAGAR